MSAMLSVSCGDVNGIGLRCFADACSQHSFAATLELAIDDSTLAKALSAYHLSGDIHHGVWRLDKNHVALVPINMPSSVVPGSLQEDAARCALSSLNTAIARTINGTVDALVTLPINKYGLARVGWGFPGQTEMVAAAAGGEPLMVLCTRDVRVALATVHVALSDVTSRLTVELLVSRIAAMRHHLVVDLGLIDPQIAVLSVDPHAGEHGVIGSVDDSLVRPAIELARANEYQVGGPFAADGFFAFGAYKRYDGIVAIYHDQGLIPLKLLAQGAGVNCTAGLRIVRTSPDHGTAYDIAAGGDVDARSTIEAIEMAIRIVRNRRTSMH